MGVVAVESRLGGRGSIKGTAEISFNQTQTLILDESCSCLVTML